MDTITLTGETATRLINTAALLCKTPEKVVADLLDEISIHVPPDPYLPDDLAQQFEAQLQRQREELDALINALPDYIFIIEREQRRIPYCNDVFARIIGYQSRADVQGKTLHECFPPAQAEYFEIQNQQVFDSGQILHLQETLELPSGLIYTDTYKIPLRHIDGTIFALLGTSHDLTELFETRQALQRRTDELETAYQHLQVSEQFLQNILDGQQAYITVLDADGTIIKVNQAWREAARLNGGSEALIAGVGFNYIEICDRVHGDNQTDAEAVAQGIRSLINGSAAKFDYEYGFLTPHGDRWFLLQAVYIPQEQSPYMIVTHNNITERKLFELETQNALAAEKELGELRTRFLSLVSHEFRTPMAIIQTSVDLLRRYFERLTPEKRLIHLNSIEEQLHNLTSMIDEISLVYRGQTGQALHFSAISITGLLQQIVEEILIAYSHRIQVIFDVPATETPYMLDKTLFYQIFTNLISNAIKYSRGNGHVSIRWREQLHYVLIEVRDHGIGIPVEDQRHLFTAFYRGSNVGETGGTGLGLIIVKQAVDAHKGKISFESQENQGTVFNVMLPIDLQTEPLPVE